MNMLHAGDLRDAVTIRRASSARQAEGDYVQTWGDHATAWAKVRPLSGREREINHAQGGTTTVEVTVRHGCDVTAADRVRIAEIDYEIDYEIESVIDIDNRHVALVLQCHEVTATPAEVTP